MRRIITEDLSKQTYSVQPIREPDMFSCPMGCLGMKGPFVFTVWAIVLLSRVCFFIFNHTDFYFVQKDAKHMGTLDLQ